MKNQITRVGPTGGPKEIHASYLTRGKVFLLVEIGRQNPLSPELYLRGIDSEGQETLVSLDNGGYWSAEINEQGAKVFKGALPDDIWVEVQDPAITGTVEY